MQTLWDHIIVCQTAFQGYMDGTWENTNVEDIQDEINKLNNTLRGIKVDKRCNAYVGILEEIKKWGKFLPLCLDLRSPSMRERHWDMIRAKVQNNFVIDENLKLKDVYDLELGKISDDVEEICGQAMQEANMEKTLNLIETFWTPVEFDFLQHKQSNVM
jgi:dynein heavy chain